MTRSRNFVALLFLFVFFSCQSVLRAQSSSPDPSGSPADQPPPSADQQPPPASEKPDAPVAKSPDTKLDHRIYNRILGIIPNFISTEDTPETRKPLTPRQKYNLAFHQMFDYSAHLGIGFSAAIDQATEGKRSFGQGWEAYGQRFGAGEAGNISGSFLTTGFFPHIFKQDPRLFRRGTGSVLSRGWYAFTRVVVTRSDDGTPMFNYSHVLGSLVEDGISTTFHPGYPHSISHTFSGWGIELAQGGGFNILSEFYPDIANKVLHRNPKPADPPTHP